MRRDQEILRTLAETLDINRTLQKYHLLPNDLRQVLLRAAEPAAETTPKTAAPDPSETFVLHVDGASRGNPGPAAAGFAIYHQGRMLEAQGQFLGRLTSNQAEYNALILGLLRLRELHARRVWVKTDSELLARQMNGIYRVKDSVLQKLFSRVRELVREFDSVKISHVPREENREADRLANRALDEFAE